MKKFNDLDDNGKVKVRNDENKGWGCIPVMVCCLPVLAFLAACAYLTKDATQVELKANAEQISYWQQAQKMAAAAASNKGTAKNFDEYKDEPKAPRIEYVEPNEKSMKDLFKGTKLPQGFSQLGQDLLILPISLV